MDNHRVRTLIPFLNYSELRKNGLLPKQALFTKIQRGGIFPSLAGKIGYSDFGLFMEVIIRQVITLEKLTVEDAISTAKDGISHEYQRYFKRDDYVSVGKMIREYFTLKDTIFEPEWKSGEIAGHPDIVTKKYVYDIKTTGRFNAMRSETILQVLSYYCIAQKIGGNEICNIGLILPAQRLVLTSNLEGWNWEPFYDELCKCIQHKYHQSALYLSDIDCFITFQMMQQQYVGGHVEKKDLVALTTTNFPLQFFVAGRASGNVTVKKSFKINLKNALQYSQSKVFIHAPYVFNLSKPYGNSRRVEDTLEPWVCVKLTELLEFGNECNLQGIVVHCGKLGGLKQTDAVASMYASVHRIAKYASVECPLLIETSSGQGGEILCSPTELASFYSSLLPKIQKRTKICIDTCHVFAAGYDPMEFISVLEEENVPVGLVHYNDSKHPKGAMKDRHASIGQGYIGIDPLFKVLTWAIERNISCVRE
uniref:AP (Apurinic) endonuclease family 2 n=1 Tax=Marseillevirus LCMAC102 TaxID=2506603 RepID=A0A481YTW7_9VIRU|nr:MAG: AP (apurinic) endonuclease family 2 [Marseillevirus LCMAC102]